MPPASPLDRYRTDGMHSLSPQRLLVMLYQRLLADLDRADTAIAASSPPEAHLALVNAQEIINELRIALDHAAWEGAPGLDALYRHLEILLVEANVTKSSAVVAQCRSLLEPLAEAWEQAYRTVTTGRVDANGQVLA
jgi:flagellar secretion chaperone FliS